MAHPYDEFSDIKFSQWAALGIKLGGRAMVDLALRDEVKFVRKGNEIIIEPKPRSIVVPSNEVVFELSLKAPIDGSKLRELFGLKAGNWSYTGQKMANPFTRRFMLANVGQCGIGRVRSRISDNLGINPQGQWLEAFRKTYPQNDGQGPIGVADSSWQGEVGGTGDYYPHFPYVRPADSLTFWDSDFATGQNKEGGNWRWLIELK